MGLEIIPAVILIAVALLSTPSTGADVKDTDPLQSVKPVKWEVESLTIDDRLDYNSIYQYIRQKFKRISDEDAAKIARSLVDYGKEHNMDPMFAAAVIARESAFNKKAISKTGAKGLGQIKDFNHKSLKISDPYDIQQNVSGTTAYLKRMLGKWKTNSDKVSLALASYYQGYTAVKRSRKKNGDVDTQTKNYVRDIKQYYDELKAYRKKLASSQ